MLPRNDKAFLMMMMIAAGLAVLVTVLLVHFAWA
jgi:hypothetical protein